MNRSMIAPVLLATGLVAGCGGPDDPTDGVSPTAKNVDIVTLNVTGTGTPVFGPVVIDSRQNGGTFHVTWDLDTNGSAVVEVSVGESDSFSGNENFEFFDKLCSATDPCGSSYDLSCTFGADHRITCSNGKGVDLSGFFASTPKAARIHLTVTGDGAGAGSAISVEFRG